MVNQTLQTRFGAATLIGDGSATFSVTYDVDGGTCIRHLTVDDFISLTVS